MVYLKPLKDFRRRPEQHREKCNQKCPVPWPIQGADYCDQCFEYRGAGDLPYYPPVEAMPGSYEKEWYRSPNASAPEASPSALPTPSRLRSKSRRPQSSQTLSAQQLQFTEMI